MKTLVLITANLLFGVSNAVAAVKCDSLFVSNASTQSIVRTAPTLENFKKDLHAEDKFSDTFDQTNAAIKSVLQKYTKLVTPEEFTTIALYLINTKTIYVGGYGAIAGEWVTTAFETIRQASLNVDLNRNQVQLIKNAMVNRPESLREFMATFNFLGWRYTDRDKLHFLVEKPFGKSQLTTVEEYDSSLQGFKTALKEQTKVAGSKTLINKVIFKLLNEYANKVTPEEFTSICLYLINWKIVWTGPYIGMDGKHTVDAYEYIRLASLNVALTKDQIFQIKSAMENRPNSLRELLSSFGESIFGWDNLHELGMLLDRPFGKPAP